MAKAYWPGFVLGLCVAALLATGWIALSDPPTALAQVPDSGAQRLEMIKEQRQTNAQLKEIAGLLREIRDQGREGKPPEKGKRPEPPKRP
jgi:hypothetical protein